MSRMGDKAKCKSCGQEIEYIGPGWRHTGGWNPRHLALPLESSGYHHKCLKCGTKFTGVSSSQHYCEVCTWRDESDAGIIEAAIEAGCAAFADSQSNTLPEAQKEEGDEIKTISPRPPIKFSEAERMSESALVTIEEGFQTAWKNGDITRYFCARAEAMVRQIRADAQELEALRRERQEWAREKEQLRDALAITQRAMQGSWADGWTIQVTGFEMIAIQEALGVPLSAPPALTVGMGEGEKKKVTSINDLLGKTLSSVEKIEDYQIIFTLEDGRQFRMHHVEDCCESVTIEDVCGEFSDLVGAPLLMAEEVTHVNENPEGVPDMGYSESFTWTFYKFATIKGYVTIRWYGTSNGYYSESVNFDEIEY